MANAFGHCSPDVLVPLVSGPLHPIWDVITKNGEVILETARFWSSRPEDGRLVCELCPRFCALQPGQRGMCFVRKREGQRIVLDTYNRSSGFCIDPIEKKPLNHFLPGTPVLSFGTAGCNLACKFCQNHEISKSRETDSLTDYATPEMIAEAAERAGVASVAYTYNDPVIFHEYAVDIAQACHDRGIRSVAVTAGYITPKPRAEFFAHMDAANIDLKGFTEAFYQKLTASHLAPVLETIEYAVKETPCWVELTTLLIPGWNDSDRNGWSTGWGPRCRCISRPSIPITGCPMCRRRRRRRCCAPAISPRPPGCITSMSAIPITRTGSRAIARAVGRC
jgi:pyruvate-formate lyase-activating enzyme